ncbi:uncharacterized protein LOC136752459 isoform X2 [Amia ocellicauda]|uniref:uncharacterized protein LOC136752459 isoform X2 n=1 Tax=Amia ocellicauda TaxID=2972642 RepID=UPI0034645AD9
MTGLLSTALLVPTRLALRLVSLCYWALVYSTAGLTAALVLTRIAWRGLRDPRGTFHWTARRSPPACTRDPALGEHAYLLTEGSGLRLHYVSKGDPSQPLMLFLHGFPENWFSWRYQLREFGGRWRAVALDLRGCGESAAPGRREDYALDQLLGDIRDIIAGLAGAQSAVQPACGDSDPGPASEWAGARGVPVPPVPAGGADRAAALLPQPVQQRPAQAPGRGRVLPADLGGGRRPAGGGAGAGGGAVRLRIVCREDDSGLQPLGSAGPTRDGEPADVAVPGGAADLARHRGPPSGQSAPGGCRTHCFLVTAAVKNKRKCPVEWRPFPPSRSFGVH